MRTLAECKEAWIKEREILQEQAGRKLAGSFLGFAPSSFLCSNRILYVGKATEGAFEPETSSPHTVESQTELARSVFEDIGRRGNPASFWGFADCASKTVQPAATGLCNIAWSNICKVGECKGPPRKDLIAAQHSLAVETLQAEITELKPAIVLFVCDEVGNQVIGDLYSDQSQSGWLRSEDAKHFGVSDVWWRFRTKDRPPAVWMRHPQGSATEIRTFVLLKMVSLL